VGKLHRGPTQQVLPDPTVSGPADEEQVGILLIGRAEHGIDRITHQQKGPEGHASVSKRGCPETLEEFSSLTLDLLEVHLGDRHEPFRDVRHDMHDHNL
jgi:hypothetical protein